MRSILLPSLVLVAFEISGCAVFESSRLDAHETAGGLVYYLPMRFAKLTFERSQLNASDAETKLRAARDALGKLAAELEAAEKTNALATRELETYAEKEVPKASAVYTDAAKRLAESAQAKATLPESIKAVAAAVKKAEADVALAAGADSWIDRFSVTVLPPVADRSQRFVVRDVHRESRTETVLLKTTRSGLLMTVDSEATDQTKEVIVALAKAAAAASVLSNRVVEAGPDSCVEVKRALKVERTVNPASRSELKRFIDAVNVAACSPKSGDTYRVAFLRGYLDTEVEQIVGVRETIESVDEALDELTPVDAAKAAEIARLLHELRSKLPHESQTPKEPTEPVAGVYYRRELPLSFGFKDAAERTVASFEVEAPNGAPAEWIDMEVGPFGHAKRNLAFDNGILISLDSTRDSEALQIASTPYDAIKAALEAMSEVVQLKLNFAVKETSAVKEQTELEKARLALEQAKAALEQARDDAATSE